MDDFCINAYENLEYTIVDQENRLLLEDALDDAGFNNKGNNVWEFPKTKNLQIKIKIINELRDYCKQCKISVNVCEKLQQHTSKVMPDDFQTSMEKGLHAKTYCPICDKKFDEHSKNDLKSHLDQFQPEISPDFIRKLQNSQKISVNHLLNISNGANFSVPGSGKTTISYAVISKWIQDKVIDKILVIGPISAFRPWEVEYQFCFGKPVSSKRIQSGKDAKNMIDSEKTLFLMYYTTAANNLDTLIEFMSNHNVLLIIDESHNIKNYKLKMWANSSLILASYARRRMILTGTPMPNDARDLWTQLTFLWPNNYPLSHVAPYVRYAKPHGIGERFRDKVKPLFTRITKDDLGLPEVKITPIRVPLPEIQRKIYNVIAAKTLAEINSLREQGRLQKFRHAKMIRLIQAASNPSTIHEKADEFEIDGINFGYPGEKISLSPLKEEVSEDIYEKIINYSKHGELPGKITAAVTLTKELVKEKKKVIIWCWSIANIVLLETQLLKDLNPVAIHGGISNDPAKVENREKLIRKFKEDPKCHILIASISAMSEAVSLHIDIKMVNGKQVITKVCSDAIYLERNFNGSQFMQSMDRIHRLGMDDKTKVEYHCLIAEGTIDEKINTRLGEKYKEMGEALNDSWITQLDYDGTEKRINKEQLKKDFQSLVEHLREINVRNN
jgi:SNF2 family DNA or RNA helicase